MARNRAKRWVGDKGPSKKAESGETEVYKVRAAITLSHYLYVEAKSPAEAERKVDKHIRDIEKNHGGYDWYGEASNMHVTYEVEEAE